MKSTRVHLFVDNFYCDSGVMETRKAHNLEISLRRLRRYGWLAQPVEQETVNLWVGGSNPSPSANFNALLAQLERVSDYESEGCRFKSCGALQISSMRLLGVVASLSRRIQTGSNPVYSTNSKLMPKSQ